MATTRRVLVASDLSDAADEAVRQAHAWARAHGADLLACHVIPEAFLNNPLFPQQTEGEAVDFVEHSRLVAQRLDERVLRLTGRSDDEYDIVIGGGEVAATLIREAEQAGASLVVVGSRGLSGIERLLIGDVAERVVRYAHGPVLVARATAKKGVVLVATDFSDPSALALKTAVEEAHARHARLALLHCVETGPAPAVALSLPFGGAWQGLPPEAIESARNATEGLLRDTAKGLGVEADILAETGDPVRSILEAADRIGAELIVIGTHGQTGIARLLLGSVAEKVVRGASCSVLVARHLARKS